MHVALPGPPPHLAHPTHLVTGAQGVEPAAGRIHARGLARGVWLGAAAAAASRGTITAYRVGGEQTQHALCFVNTTVSTVACES